MATPIQFTGNFTQAGDVLTLDYKLGRHDLQLRAEIEADGHQSIRDEEFDFDPERAAAWRRGEWQYLGVVVTMRIDGEEIECQQLWGIDVGDDARYLLCVANDLLGQFSLPLRLGMVRDILAKAEPPRRVKRKVSVFVTVEVEADADAHTEAVRLHALDNLHITGVNGVVVKAKTASVTSELYEDASHEMLSRDDEEDEDCALLMRRTKKPNSTGL